MVPDRLRADDMEGRGTTRGYRQPAFNMGTVNPLATSNRISPVPQRSSKPTYSRISLEFSMHFASAASGFGWIGAMSIASRNSSGHLRNPPI